VTHPIHLRTTKTETIEIDDDDEEAIDADAEDDVPKDVSDEAEEKKVKIKKTEEVTTVDWVEINNNPAIWTRDKDAITDDEYQSFWKVVAKEESTTAAQWTHFNAEGSINFKSILYLPTEVPDHYRFGNIDSVSGGLKLYVRKVLISDEFSLMPRYLGFIRGVVDSDDLPLNVNRETLQESKIVKVIKKKLVRKALDMIRAFSQEKDPESEAKEAEIDADGNVVVEAEENKPAKDSAYLQWYKKFGPNLKMGILDDEANRSKLAKLLRFQTSKSDGKFISLQDYIENMKDWQDQIFVLAGLNVDEVKKSAFLDRFTEKDVEVVYLVDPVDEYMMQQMRDFDGKKFQAISAENVKLKDEDEDLAKRREKAYKDKFKPLTKYLKKLFGSNIMRVAISKRLGNSPAIVSSSEYGHSANMERIMRAQAFNHGQNEMQMRAMKILEINPRHPLILKLLSGCPPEKEEEAAEPFVVSKEIEDAAWTLHDMALLSGGFPIEDGNGHTARLIRYLKSSLDLDSLKLEDEIDPPVEEETAPDFDMDSLDGMNMGDFNMDQFDMDNMDLD
jgi:heat shock protein 90kDa beta